MKSTIKNICKGIMLLSTLLLCTTVFSSTAKANTTLTDIFGEPLRYNTPYYIYYMLDDFRAADLSDHRWEYVILSHNISYVQTNGEISAGYRFVITPEDNNTSVTTEIQPNTNVSFKVLENNYPSHPYWTVHRNEYIYLHNYSNSTWFRLSKGLYGINFGSSNNHATLYNTRRYRYLINSSSKPDMGEFRFVPTDLRAECFEEVFNNDRIKIEEQSPTTIKMSSNLGVGQNIQVYAINEHGLETLIGNFTTSNFEFQHIYGASAYIIIATNGNLRTTQKLTVYYEDKPHIDVSSLINPLLL